MPKELSEDGIRKQKIDRVGAEIAQEMLIRYGGKFASYGKFKANDNTNGIEEWILGYSKHIATKIIDFYEYKDETS